MANIEELKSELHTTKTLRTITGAYSDVSALRIVGLKKAFEQNSLFYEQISQLYHAVRISEHFRQIKDDRPLKPKTLHIALTSNQHFYGNINRSIMEEFFSETENSSNDRLVIGITGKEYCQANTKSSGYSFLVFESETPTKEEEQYILRVCDEYDRVFVYYPKFITMLTQVADRKDITFAPTPTFRHQREIKYIFEPELPKLLAFFRHQIRSVLFSQVILESILARTATRLVSMDTAEKKAEEKIREFERIIRTGQQASLNSALIETIIWRTKQHA